MFYGSVKKYSGLFVGFLLWALTTPYQDYICFIRAEQLQQSLHNFQQSPAVLPPFGVWESIALADHRLGIGLLSFYQEIGAQDRAIEWALRLQADSSSMTKSIKDYFYTTVLSLPYQPQLHQKGLEYLKTTQPNHPVWLLQQHILHSKNPEIFSALDPSQKAVLWAYLCEIGEESSFAELSTQDAVPNLALTGEPEASESAHHVVPGSLKQE